MKTRKAVLFVVMPRQFYTNLLPSAVASLFLFTTSPLFAADSPTPADRKQPSKEAANRAKAQPFSDRNILLAIESEFQFDPAVDGRPVDVAVNDGIVTLTGEKERAKRVASQVKGVGAVDNNLTVQPQSWAVQSDDETEKDIEQRLKWSAFVDESDVEVAVNTGVATLTGKVGSLAEEEAAVFIAPKAGARFVRDELVIRNPFSQAEGTEPRG